jgi:Tfp pilus assembly protein PilW
MRLTAGNQGVFGRRSGMTLVEILLTSLIGSIVLAVVATLTIFAARSVLAMTNYSELDRMSRNCLDFLTRDIRQASGLANFNSNRIVLNIASNTTCTYTYDRGLGTLTRVAGTERTVLLKGCDQLTFQVSQRNPSNDFTFYKADTLATAKLIDVSWKCSREIKAQKVNTESIQTAKIVMRN